MKSAHGINFLNEVVLIKQKTEMLVREINTFLTEDEGTSLKFHLWERIKNQIKELAEAIK